MNRPSQTLQALMKVWIEPSVSVDGYVFRDSDRAIDRIHTPEEIHTHSPMSSEEKRGSPKEWL